MPETASNVAEQKCSKCGCWLYGEEIERGCCDNDLGCYGHRLVKHIQKNVEVVSDGWVVDYEPMVGSLRVDDPSGKKWLYATPGWEALVLPMCWCFEDDPEVSDIETTVDKWSHDLDLDCARWIAEVEQAIATVTGS